MTLSGPLKINEHYFSDSLQSKPSVLPGLLFHISFWDGEIMIQLSSNKHVINAVFVDRCMTFLEDEIRNSV